MRAAFLLLLLPACVTVIPPVGTSCDAGVAYCASKTSALSCEAGVLVPHACGGPKRCVRDAKRVVFCDELDGGSP